MEQKFRVIYDTSEETRIKEIARLREKALHDEASALKNAKAEGLEEGLIKGRAEGKAEGRVEGKTEERNLTMQKMKALGFTDEQIKAIYPDLV